MKNQNKLAAFTAVALIAIAVLAPKQVLAAWPESAFEARSVSDAMGNLFGSADNTPSGKIKITVPDVVETGARVSVTVTTAMQASAIAIIVEKNPMPLAANFELSDSASGFVETSIRVCETSDIIAVVKSGGKLFTARKNVKVSGGDCASYGGGGKKMSRKSIRIRIQVQKGSTRTIKAQIAHPMESGLRKDRKSGNNIPAHYITEVRGEHNGKIIVTAQFGPAVSANPRLSFEFAGARQGDSVKLDWVDNQGQSDSATEKIR